MWTHVGVRGVVVGWCFQLGLLWWSRQKGGAGTGKRADSSKSRSLTLFSITFVFAPRRDWLPELPPTTTPTPQTPRLAPRPCRGSVTITALLPQQRGPPKRTAISLTEHFSLKFHAQNAGGNGTGGTGGMGGHKALIEAAMHHLCFIQTADAGASHQAAKQGTAQREIFKIQFKRPQSRLL